MIGLSTKLFDLDGYEIFNIASILELSNKIERRVTSTPTLDGNSYVSDQGYSSSDKLLNFKILHLSKERVDNLIRIAKYHSRIWISLDEGPFEGVIKQIYYTRGMLSMTIIISGDA